ncbi:MAG: efflux RND transporter periplasmic adaptor subunit [bacterium]|nr:efflux RND transporter periplasmic adaptor subunit [bacterium]
MVTTTKMRPWMWSLVVLVLAGCGEGGQQSGGGFRPPPTPVETAVVSAGTVMDRFTTVGTLEAREDITVTGEIDGIVMAVPFREGGRLAAGELIARLDDAQLGAEVQRARALRDQKLSSWERIRNIVDQGAGTPQDLDDAVAALKVAEADLALAETRLAKTRITAPFAGLAGKRQVSRGAYLRAGDRVTTLTRVDSLRVAFAVPERILASLRVGASISVGTIAFPEMDLSGTVDVIEPRLDAATRAVNVVALIDNPEDLLRPGMSATIEVILAERPGALTVPSAAVFVEGGQAYVYAVQPDSVVTRAAVVLGTRLAEEVEIVSGLEAGRLVVRTGHQKLYEGAKVAPVSAAVAQEGEAR